MLRQLPRQLPQRRLQSLHDSVEPWRRRSGRIPIGGGGLRSASAPRMRAQRIRPDAEALSGVFPQSSPDDDVGAAAEDERGVKVLRRDPAE